MDVPEGCYAVRAGDTGANTLERNAARSERYLAHPAPDTEYVRLRVWLTRVNNMMINPNNACIWVGKHLVQMYNQYYANVREDASHAERQIIPDHPAAWGRSGESARETIEAYLGPVTDSLLSGQSLYLEDRE